MTAAASLAHASGPTPLLKVECRPLWVASQSYRVEVADEIFSRDDCRPVAGEKVVLLGNTVSIADLGAFAPSDLAGVVCLAGSSLSHTAVVARSLGIPAVFATGPIDRSVLEIGEDYSEQEYYGGGGN